MKKSIYVTILSSITVVCILIGSIIHLTDTDLGIFDRWFRQNKNTEISQDPISLEEFSSISADATIMELTIKSGNAYEISCRYNEKVRPEYQVKDQVLRITQNADNIPITGNSAQCEVIVTVPSNADLSEITANVDLGVIKISKITAASLDLTADLGDVELEHCDLGNASISADMGDIDVSSCTFSNLTAEVSMGDLSVDTSSDLSGYTIDISVDLGSLKVNGRDYKNQFSQRGSTDRTIVLTNDMGDAELEYD